MVQMNVHARNRCTPFPLLLEKTPEGPTHNKCLASSPAFTVACHPLTLCVQPYLGGRRLTLTITRHKRTHAHHLRIAPLPDKLETRGSTRAEGRTAGTNAAPGDTRATRGKYTTPLDSLGNEHILEDVRDFQDPELVEDRVEGDAVEAPLHTVEEEGDRWIWLGCILAISLRSFTSIPGMVCCCFFVFLGSKTGCRRRRERREGGLSERATLAALPA